ncbi:hypothetical protein [Pleurocapsa sp. FMAR1]|uniref:hypothetical protein n=1 Tax=Pleurocapsa sp. FMAR1 TaxID=3040204 RepID=UPI0029C6B978|nr:hypothetical protein [Pleurocapsa sp. FMAR1]
MNILKLNIWLMLVANLVLAAMAADSTMAEVTKKSDRAEEKNTRFLTGNKTSTKAIDLITLPNQKNLIDSSLKSQIAQRDLAKFCQDYPYNSQCAGISPSNNNPPGVETIPVPAPPPTSETETNDRNSSGQKTGWAIAPEISTLGFGGNIIRKITPAFNARVGVNAFGVGINLNESQFDYDGDLNLFNVSSIIDVHPFKSSGFRISAGLIFSNNNIQGTADVSEQVADEIGNVGIFGQTIDIRDFIDIQGLVTLDADVDITNSVSPYLGIGGGNPVGEGKGLGFWWNAGVVFGGSPDVTVTPNIPNSVPEEFRSEVQEAANTLIESEEQDIEDDLDFLSVYPVLSLGISYQF